MKTKNDFRKIRREYSLLLQFDDPVGLVDFLNAKTGDYSEKDLIYEILLKVIQGKGNEAESASTILWLGLWPGLDALYRHRLKYFLNDPEELVSSLSAAFTALVERIDLSRVQRISSTLIRSTGRDIMYQRKRAWTEAEYLDDKKYTDDDDDNDDDDHLDFKSPVANRQLKNSPFVIGSGLSADAEFAVLRDRLFSFMESDADLLLAVLVMGLTQMEAGRLLGISHDASRKRVQRAIERLRKNLQDSLSHSADRDRVSSADGSKAKGNLR